METRQEISCASQSYYANLSDAKADCSSDLQEIDFGIGKA